MIDTAQALGEWLSVTNEELAKRDAEIKRLRELLRTCWARDGSTPITWPAAVREALSND